MRVLDTARTHTRMHTSDRRRTRTHAWTVACVDVMCQPGSVCVCCCCLCVCVCIPAPNSPLTRTRTTTQTHTQQLLDPVVVPCVCVSCPCVDNVALPCSPCLLPCLSLSVSSMSLCSFALLSCLSLFTLCCSQLAALCVFLQHTGFILSSLSVSIPPVPVCLSVSVFLSLYSASPCLFPVCFCSPLYVCVFNTRHDHRDE